MNFWERKARAEREGSGQNPTPTQEEHERIMEKVGDFWWPKGFNAGHDIYYGDPKEKPVPLNARSFGNERPPIELRNPPTRLSSL